MDTATMDRVFLEATMKASQRILAKLPRPLRRRRRRAPNPDARPRQSERALREVMSEADAVTLVEAMDHERRSAALWGRAAGLTVPRPPAAIADALATIQEDAEVRLAHPGETGARITLPASAGWNVTAPGRFTHPTHGHVHIDTASGAWRHHNTLGQVVRRGSGQASLSEHLALLASTMPESATDTLRRRLAGVEPVPDRVALAYRLSEAFAGRRPVSVDHTHLARKLVGLGEQTPDRVTLAVRLADAATTGRRREGTPDAGDLHARLARAATRTR